MLYKDKEILFPATTQVSFFKLIERLKKKQENNVANDFECNLLEKIKDKPELIEGIENTYFDKDNELVKKLCSTLFPDALRTNEIKGIIPPFEFQARFT